MVPHVVDIEIHIVHAKVLQAPVQHPLDVLLAGHAGLDLLGCARQELGRNDHFIAFRKIAQRAAEILLAGAALVGDRGVEKVDAQLQTAPDDLTRMCFVDRPAVLAVLRIAESHAAHADAGHLQI